MVSLAFSLADDWWQFNRRNDSDSSSSENDDYADAINDNDSYGASWAMEGVTSSYFGTGGGHFSETYACRSVEELSSGLRQQVEFGGKGIMCLEAVFSFNSLL